MCARAGFFGKNPHRAKLTKNRQKRPKNMVFGLSASKWAILGPNIAHPHNSGSAGRIFLKILHNEKR